jgi:hypothetical protein
MPGATEPLSFSSPGPAQSQVLDTGTIPNGSTLAPTVLSSASTAMNPTPSGDPEQKPLERLPGGLQMPDTKTEFDCLAELAREFLDSNPRRVKRLVNTYRYVKVLAFQRGEPVLADEWQKTMLAWLAFTMKWPAFLNDVIKDALMLDTTVEPREGFMQHAIDTRPHGADKPNPADVARYLPLSRRRICELWEVAGNFLIENPDPLISASVARHSQHTN